MNTPLDNIVAALKLCPSIKSCDIECGNESFNVYYTVLDYYYLFLLNINNSNISISCALNPSQACVRIGNNVIRERPEDESVLLEFDVKIIELKSLGENLKQNYKEWDASFKYKYQSDLHI